MRKILFVDDQEHVLRGLRRMLDHMQSEWEMQFAGSGQEALEIMAKNPFDVVVTDMRMPGMDGAQLLEEVSKRHPQTVRIVLTGQADRESVLRAVRPTHQYLSKPCDAETLHYTVARACAIRGLLAEPSLKQLVSQISSLPSVPSLYTELLEELKSCDGSIQRVGQLISQDIAMTAKILQLTNSALFGLRQQVHSPAQAAILLGMETLKALVLSVQLFSQFKKGDLRAFSIEALLQHSLAVGNYARLIAKAERAAQALVSDAFLAGVLHDAGKLVLATNAPEQYHHALTLAGEKRIPLWVAERETFGVSHAEVGAYLLALWGLPESIVEATAFHHQPGQCQHKHLSSLTVVHVANALEQQRNPAKLVPAAPVDIDYLTFLGLADRLAAWQELCQSGTVDLEP